MIAVDLFARAGGLSIGIQRAGFEVVFANELEVNMAKPYAANHPNTRVVNRSIHAIFSIVFLDIVA